MMLYLLVVAAIFDGTRGQSSTTTNTSLLPTGWDEICQSTSLVANDSNASFSCHVTREAQVQWRLADLRASLATKDVKVSFNVTCEQGANISLPWPMKAPGLVELRVRDCILLDQFADFQTPAEKLSDSLRVLDMQHCTWLTDVQTFLMFYSKMENMSEEFDCGQDSSLVEYIMKNISRHLRGLSKSLSGLGQNSGPSKGADTGTIFKKLLEKTDKIDIRCYFSKLQVLDESNTDNFPKHHFEMMVPKNKYPSLRIMNYRNIGLLSVPEQLKQWTRFFPKLEVIDLSYNRIKDLNMEYPFPSNVSMTLVLHYNNITKISMDILKNWAQIPGLYVDIRHNPINCTCELGNLLDQLNNTTAWTGLAMTYYRSYVPDLTCFTPEALKGRRLGSLSLDDLPCHVLPYDLRPALAALAVVVLVLLVFLLLAVRYRREVRILVFTRAHVLLPCGLPLANVDVGLAGRKTYDAFVAYAHEDSEWVLKELCHRLENSSTPSRPACKLCIHQRDFVVGKTIIDNIIDSIASSRHTIVVVSPSFVKSAWAMEELQQAFRQSLEERRRHLVIVMLKDVQMSKMPLVLRRCCKTFTYLEANDSLFWDRLLYSLHVTEKKKSIKLHEDGENGEEKKDEIQGEGNRKLEDNPIDAEFRRALFLESMRSLSVDSTSTVVSTVSDDRLLVTPSPAPRLISPFRF
ncbi:hypothetical protein C0Q70_18821 [Pomacea canaliculata]|uniref:TIR domain-containing protein n=1 Tax=Pomacea canaliculata TaxID=400727 RepID=A0A2T7NHL0_POMCA|nr:toll-like receptor 2 type-2 [Pomacea canaliculata]XP_025076095.1 toll-like receptor 2 type-2 [Pomacea canaliculata]XP_025076096.1 toll-like receptor 2 type-2 [Pomacea canaliculata]XP_025076097.1 toll-like receptor 2 type-2 [Pomacea canaliculata]XP_025076098.1 toll-like receptor 2 type-2 [Pomacea canaliculata]PVD20663.1 hypothetical protein C0Q70_18821 [Pomacea canaliculata]